MKTHNALVLRFTLLCLPVFAMGVGDDNDCGTGKDHPNPSQSYETFSARTGNTYVYRTETNNYDAAAELITIYQQIRTANLLGLTDPQCLNLAEIRQRINDIKIYNLLLSLKPNSAAKWDTLRQVNNHGISAQIIRRELLLIYLTIRNNNRDKSLEYCAQEALLRQKRYALDQYNFLLVENPEEAEAWRFFRRLELNGPGEPNTHKIDGPAVACEVQEDQAKDNIIIIEVDPPSPLANHNSTNDNTMNERDQGIKDREQIWIGDEDDRTVVGDLQFAIQEVMGMIRENAHYRDFSF